MDKQAFYTYSKIRWKNAYTRRQYNLMAKRVEQFWEDDKITQRTINNFQASIADNESYGNPIYNAFLKNYIDCYSQDLEQANIKIKIIKPTSYTRKHLQYKFLTQKEMFYIIKFVENKFLRLCIRAYAETGLRCSELLNIRGSDIDLEHRTFSGIGKGNKEFIVPFSSGLRDWLKQWLKECVNPDTPFVIYKKNGDASKPLMNQQFGMWRLVKRACESMGLPGIHPHRFRHFLGHALSERGWQLNEIQSILRHSNIQTTTIYAPTIKENVDNKLKRDMFGENI